MATAAGLSTGESPEAVAILERFWTEHSLGRP